MDQQDKNENTDSQMEIDPDYESTNLAIRRGRVEGIGHLPTEEKLKSIIRGEFDKELQIRQKQLEEIEEKVFKAQKLLHVVRYVLISSYYNKKALEYEAEGSLNSSDILSSQNRIHPAVKKLIGKNANKLEFLTSRTKRKVTEGQSKPPDKGQSEAKKMKLEPNENRTIPATIVKPQQQNSEELATNRNRIQHRLVVGNISYYKKSLEQNNLTHKWMVYVKIFKGLKDGIEVTNLTVDKVVFFLHPSYKPHDVVDIGHPPFHLSRRGWGEFRLRVKIHFKSPMNKPVDVIHQLKLDNTFTERQTLGNQTVVPLFLHEDLFQVKQDPDPVILNDDNILLPESLSDNNFDLLQLDNMDLNPFLNDKIISIEPIKIEPSTSFEHDYCFDDITIKHEDLNIIDDYTIVEQQNPEFVLRDHAYTVPAIKEGQKSHKKQKTPIKQGYNELMYGLGTGYLDPGRSRPKKIVRKASVMKSPEKLANNSKSLYKVLKTVTGQSIRVLPESFNQLLLNNGSIVSVKLLKSPTKDNATTNCSKTSNILKLPNNNKFKNMGEVLPYLFKRLPIWNPEADEDYKCTYPFTASSKNEYLSWNVGKKLAAEWSRAKAIKRILAGEPYSKNWTTKAIFMYARSHLYTPLVSSYRLFRKDSVERSLILDCYKGTHNQNSGLAYPIHDEAINIVSPVKPVIDPINSNSIETCIDISDKNLSEECAFIKEAALDVGIVLKPEVLVEGVSMNASERILFEAVKCFAENLIRTARTYLICEKKYSNETAEITTKQINRVMGERKEFQSIRKYRENKIASDFFS
ncbi:unnamed protein product [Ceutorhynchus assimilis]|uniref:YEATS domain-containing protein n=1 Tax=Ceutorhynchus assimilis TaxID=467358 RepID=A0A9N9MPG8_9CUCU|nr:unnamed protein product [Ceutorhynchus assimilis]